MALVSTGVGDQYRCYLCEHSFWMEQMNERIQQLIKAATVTEKGPLNWDLTDTVVIERVDNELLTQLVAKECIAMAEALGRLYNREDIGFDVGYKLGANRVATEIKNMYGITDDVPNA